MTQNNASRPHGRFCMNFPSRASGRTAVAAGKLFFAALLVFMVGCSGSDSGAGLEQPVVETMASVEPPPVEEVSSPEDETDLSGLREVIMDDLPEDIEHAARGAFEGGAVGGKHDTSAGNRISKEAQQYNKRFDVPTNGAPSRLFGVSAFSQPMWRFEEFGSAALADANVNPETAYYLPRPADAGSMPDSQALDDYLNKDIYPAPTRWANTVQSNPWQPLIEGYLGRDLDTPPIEGRPPGEGWAHQRWDEFGPKYYFQTAQTGARVNSGLRDGRQTHGYSQGEFAPGGLYHKTTGVAGSEGTTADVAVRFHPGFPEQDPNALWTFDGTFPPKLLKVRYGEPVLMRHHNALPVDVSANRGFGLHTLSTHEHNGHNPAESDGYTNAFFFPGQYYDYRWPVTLAGHDSINTDASDPRAGSPDGEGGITQIPGDWRETMSTHWFHDHMLDFTAQNVYKGNVAMMNYYSAVDRGNESIDDGVNLRMPSGSSLDWGNRDYDVQLLLADKAWDEEGQLWFNPFNQQGFIGDVMTVNWLYKPYFEVRARRYRFRILNGSVSRYFKLALVNEAGAPVPFHMVANDGNIMEHSVLFANGELPTIGVAERYDIIIDFSRFEEGDKLYLVNMLQHKNGQATDEIIPLEDIASGAYAAQQLDDDEDGTPNRWSADPVVGTFMEFQVQAYDEVDQSLNPVDYVAGQSVMIPLRRPTDMELETALHRTFEFERQATDENPWMIETDGGKGFTMDPRRLSAAPSKNSSGLEVWRLLNSGTWSHPIHIHFEEGIVLRRDGKAPPEWEKWARKDVYRLGPQPDSGDSVEIALRFREFAGTFMEHCHNTQHEDHAMLLRWDIENPGQTLVMPAPIPSWDGVSYVDTHALATFRTGDAQGEIGPNLDDQAVKIWLEGMEIEQIDMLNMEVGDALNPTEDERGVGKIPLRKAKNIDADGNETDVWFVFHDVSDRPLSEEYGVAWAGALAATPPAATSEADYSDETGEFTFYGDLPNPVLRGHMDFVHLDGEAPPHDDDNNYSPLRQVTMGGKDVIVNTFFIKWGDEGWEQLRIDVNCDPAVAGTFPDEPPNTSCKYNGNTWSGDTGHALEINTGAEQPYVKMKLHKSWTEDGDYLPYYVVVDTFPSGPAKAMGVIYVPKHRFLGATAVPLVQFIPSEPFNESYPPTKPVLGGLSGGGPLAGQIGIPSYSRPEDDYSPMWHIGFAHWTVDDADEVKVVKSLAELKFLREEDKLMIGEFPPPKHQGADNYDFDSLNSPHIVNCPTPVTIDMVIHRVRKLEEEMKAAR